MLVMSYNVQPCLCLLNIDSWCSSSQIVIFTVIINIYYKNVKYGLKKLCLDKMVTTSLLPVTIGSKNVIDDPLKSLPRILFCLVELSSTYGCVVIFISKLNIYKVLQNIQQNIQILCNIVLYSCFDKYVF